MSYGGAAAALVLAALIVSRLSAPGGVDRPQIAVLPLANVTTDANNAQFADDLTDEIIRNLGTVRGLDVRSRESSFAFKGTPKSIGEVGRELGVDYLLEDSCCGPMAAASASIHASCRLTGRSQCGRSHSSAT